MPGLIDEDLEVRDGVGRRPVGPQCRGEHISADELPLAARQYLDQGAALRPPNARAGTSMPSRSSANPPAAGSPPVALRSHVSSLPLAAKPQVTRKASF